MIQKFTGKSCSTGEEAACLQNDLCKLVDWRKDWQMLFNSSKCKRVIVDWNSLPPEAVEAKTVLQFKRITGPLFKKLAYY
ncbi:hypothetical protein HOLleu_41817 [Holothuria leucospilota]|uniref:Uncharacterized protein n=1 Tax=Holothuria leucospilota TaxID=206669 RepID=A0A9Q1BAY8_HOLLE|nr:hypothetical protein HOLleu_41817 [Holothuria leucospilota]